jgi:hypothetical protein
MANGITEDKPWNFPYEACPGKIDVDRIEAIDLTQLWECVREMLSGWIYDESGCERY